MLSWAIYGINWTCNLDSSFWSECKKKKSLLLLMNIITQPTERSCPPGIRLYEVVSIFAYTASLPGSLAALNVSIQRLLIQKLTPRRYGRLCILFMQSKLLRTNIVITDSIDCEKFDHDHFQWPWPLAIPRYAIPCTKWVWGVHCIDGRYWITFALYILKFVCVVKKVGKILDFEIE